MSVDKAFETESILVNDTGGILAGVDDPSTGGGVEAPQGSLYMRTNGSHYRKVGGADTDWAEVDDAGVPDPHAEEAFNQTTHGFSVGDVIRYDTGAWVLAQADTADNSEAQGVVSVVSDVDNFTVTYSGRIEGLSGRTPDSIYYLSAATPGGLVLAEPVSPLISKPILFATSATSAIVRIMRGVSSTAPSTALMRIGHTYAIAGEIRTPLGDDYFLIPFTVSLAAGQSAVVSSCRYSINSGTSVTCKIQKNGVDLTGFTGIAVSTTPTSTDPADQAVADNDELALVVTAVAGKPQNLSFTIFLENTQTVS